MVGEGADADAATARFCAYWEDTAALAGSVLVYNTGRSLGQFTALWAEKAGALALPDVLITAVGTKARTAGVACILIHSCRPPYVTWPGRAEHQVEQHHSALDHCLGMGESVPAATTYSARYQMKASVRNGILLQTSLQRLWYPDPVLSTGRSELGSAPSLHGLQRGLRSPRHTRRSSAALSTAGRSVNGQSLSPF